MLMIFMFTILYAYFIIFDLIPLFKSKKNFVLNLITMIFAYSLCVLTALKINIPSPAWFLKNLVEAIFGKQ